MAKRPGTTATMPPPTPVLAGINGLVRLTLISMGDVERGLDLFAAHPTLNQSVYLGQVMGTRWYPDAWTSPAFPAFLRRTGIAEYWDLFGAPDVHVAARQQNAYYV